MGKSLYATVREISLSFYGPNKKKNPNSLFIIKTLCLISSSVNNFKFKLSKNYLEKYPVNAHSRLTFMINDDNRQDIFEEIKANLYPKSKIHVVFSGLNGGGMIEFMNEIGDQGWDTSGQLPSTQNGSTYVTMMRKRIS
jgi:hypothetical protein